MTDANKIRYETIVYDDPTSTLGYSLPRYRWPQYDLGLVETINFCNVAGLDLSPTASFWYKQYRVEDMNFIAEVVHSRASQVIRMAKNG